MVSPAPAAAPPSRPASGPLGWQRAPPVRQQQCISATVCRVSQPAAGHPSRNSCSSTAAANAAGLFHSTARHGQQQQVAAGEVLERAAAAVRPAGPPPEHNTASSSSSSRGGSSNGHYGNSPMRHTNNSGIGSSEQLLAPASAAAVLATDDAAAASAEAMAGTLATAELQSWPASSAFADALSTDGTGGSSSSSSSSSSRTAITPAKAAGTSNRLSDTDWALMQRIRQQCQSCGDLETLYQDTWQQFSAQHHAAALYHLATLWQQLLQQAPPQAQLFSHASRLQKERAQMQQLAGSLLRALTAQLADTQLRDLADAWFAVDVLGLLQPAAVAGTNSLPGSASLPDSSNSSSSSSNSDWAAAGARHANAAFVAVSLQRSASLLRQPELVQLRHLSRLLTSFAHLRMQPGSDWWAAALDAAAEGMEAVLQQRQPQQPAEALGPSNSMNMQQQQPQQQPLQQQEAQQPEQEEPSLQAACSTPALAAAHANAQAVALIGWAAAKLQAPASPAWWQLFRAASAHLMPAMWASHLCNCLNALAHARQAPDAAWMGAFYAACSCCWEHFTSQGLANILWALAALQQQPPRDWLASLDAASAAKLQYSSLQHLGISAWALARLQQLQDPAAAPAAAEPAAAGLSSSDPDQGVEQQQPPLQVPSPAWQEQAWVQLFRLDIGSHDPQGLACLLWGVVRLQLQLPQARWLELEGLCLEALRHMGPQALSVTVWALGSLRGPAVNRRLPRLVRSRCALEPGLLQEASPEALCMLLSGLAQMDAWHPESFKGKLLAAVAARVPTAQQLQVSKKQRRRQQQQQQQSAAGSAQPLQQEAASTQLLQAESLPYVLVYLRRLRVVVPPGVLGSIEAALEQRLQALPLPQLCLGLFALAACKHTASTGFLVAALGRVEAQLQHCSWLDVSHVLFSLAVMSSWGGSLRLTLQQPEQQAQLQGLVAHAQEALPQMDHRSLAMLLWSLGRLQLQPSEPFLQAVLASTLQHVRSMSLLSIVTILSACRALGYLPPLPWMVEVCGAARAKVGSDATAKVWQQRGCVRRFEETVAWYNQAMQQQTGGGSSSVEGSLDGEEGMGESGQQQQEVAVARRRAVRMGMAGSEAEAMLAAAVGVAAAVAQQWHP